MTEFAFRGTATPGAWREWEHENVAVRDGAVTIRRDRTSTYVSPRALVAELPTGLDPVDVDVDHCGVPYVLAASGRVYRYDRPHDELRRLPCTWFQEAAGPPRALAVTRDSIYVASGAPPSDGDGSGGQLHAVSRHVFQTRWIESERVADPIALARADGGLALLDAGEGASGGDSGVGSLLTVDPRGTVTAVREGVAEPRDVTVDRDGRRYLLQGGASSVVRTFEPDGAERSAHAVPERLDPASVAVGGDDEIVLGVRPSASGREALFRFRPERGAFVQVGSLQRSCPAIARGPAGPAASGARLYAVAHDPDEADDLLVLDAAERTRLDDRTGRYEGRVVTRLDSGERGTQWHRVTLAAREGGPSTQVRVRYYATDDERLRHEALEPEASLDLRDVEGIGPTYARRLREAGVETLRGLIALSVETIAAIASQSAFDVSVDRASTWFDRARQRAETHPDGAAAAVGVVSGIGPTYGDRLRAAGVETLADLLALEPAAVASLVSTDVIDVSTDVAAEWIDHARGLLGADAASAGLNWQSIDVATPEDALLSEATGRYLWVQLELIGSGSAAPSVERFRGYFPRQSYLRHLPAIYREDAESAAFLERYLSIFESTFLDAEEEIEHVDRFLDPDGVPAEYLSWLGDWLALETDETWSEQAHRRLVSRASELFEQRGTPAGLRETIGLYLEDVPTPAGWSEGADRERELIERRRAADALSDDEAARALARLERSAYLLEHSDLSCIEDEAVGELYGRLFGCPQCFLVLLHPRVGDHRTDAVEQIVERQRPAHTVGRTVELQPWTRLAGEEGDRGYHTYLGVNTVLANREFVVEESGLGRDTVLGERESAGQLGVQSRLGADADLS